MKGFAKIGDVNEGNGLPINNNNNNNNNNTDAIAENVLPVIPINNLLSLVQ